VEVLPSKREKEEYRRKTYTEPVFVALSSSRRAEIKATSPYKDMA
jgi:hypothetical protein